MPTVDQAENLMREGAFSEAKKILSQILNDNPGDLRAVCDIGIAYTETGENEKAIKALEHYIRNDDSNPYAWEAIGCARFRIGELEEAKHCLERSLELSPDNPSSLRNLGIIEGMEGYHEKGLKLLQDALRLAPGDFRTLYALSYAYRDLNKREQRRKVIDQLLDLELPDDINKDAQLTRIRMNLGWE
ncbi:MAG: tetratricopeptide repeat protein [Spirochaetales bacterium]|nr:tetratricopeptide repeat protein [Spirochaetales bacterium]